MNANLASIMPQVIGVWCEEAGHSVSYVCYTGYEDLNAALPAETDIVFIGAFSETAQLAYALSALYRQRGTVTVLGGPHARCYPEDSVRYFDYVLGFTDQSIIDEVLRECAPHRPMGIALAAPRQPLQLPGVRARWRFIKETLDKAPAIKIVPMLASLGCPYTCSFCSFGKLPWRTRKIEEVLRELVWLKETYSVQRILFFDDVLTLDQKRIEKLMQGMITAKLDMEWVCCTRANNVSLELLRLMKRAGCKEIAFGIESGSDQVLADTTKGVSKDQIRQAAKWCHQVGILFYGLAIIGLPGETEQSVQDTIDFINEIEPFYSQFGFCTPFPNTDTYDFFKSKGLLKTEDWSQYFPLGERPVIRTEALDEAALVRLRRKLYWSVLLKPGKLLRAVRPLDWRYNWMGIKKVAGRVGMLAKGGPLR